MREWRSWELDEEDPLARDDGRLGHGLHARLDVRLDPRQSDVPPVRVPGAVVVLELAWAGLRALIRLVPRAIGRAIGVIARTWWRRHGSARHGASRRRPI